MQGRVRVALCIAIVLLTLAVALVMAAADAPATTVRVLPAGGTYPVGEEIEVEIWICDVENLYGIDVQLEFDAQRLLVIDAIPWLPGIQVQPLYDWFYPDFIVRNNVTYTLSTTGTIWFAASQLNPRPPVSGSGAILAFRAQTLAAGDAWVHFKRVQLADPNAMPIAATTQGAVYQIGGPRQVFLPLIMANR